MSDAEDKTRTLLVKLASDPASVRADEHATSNMQSWGLTSDDVREAVHQAIENGDRVKETVVKTHPKGMVGEPAYELTPMIDNRRFYLRVAIFEPIEGQEALLVISVHPDV